MLGGYVPAAVVEAIHRWVEEEPERDISTFLRQAAREKLRRDGIEFSERVQSEAEAA